MIEDTKKFINVGPKEKLWSNCGFILFTTKKRALRYKKTAKKLKKKLIGSIQR